MKKQIFIPVLLAVLVMLTGCSAGNTKRVYGIGEPATIKASRGTYTLTLSEFKVIPTFHIEALEGEAVIYDGYSVYLNGSMIGYDLEAREASILEGYSTDVSLLFKRFFPKEGDEVVIIYSLGSDEVARFEVTYHNEPDSKAQELETEKASKEVQLLDEIIEEKQEETATSSGVETKKTTPIQSNDLDDEEYDLNGIPEELFDTYVDDGEGFTFVISSPNEIIRIYDGKVYKDEVVGAKWIERDHTTVGLHIMAKGDGEELNYMSSNEGCTLSLSSRCGWKEDDLSHVATQADKVSYIKYRLRYLETHQ